MNLPLFLSKRMYRDTSDETGFPAAVLIAMIGIAHQTGCDDYSCFCGYRLQNRDTQQSDWFRVTHTNQ